ncbi:MAG: tetratricopeptide repeat protein [Lentisphaeria bacterium]|nr:tetratricopeptide repeat protein [Lentisphaeria bacterium]
MTINREDYAEPRCPLGPPDDGGPSVRASGRERIPLPEIIAECDRLFQAEKTAELGEHLRFWRARARELGDEEGELSILSELMGHYRMSGDRERGLAAVRDGFALMGKLNLGRCAAAGTILINGATALQAFGEYDEALRHYAEAFRCYGDSLAPDDWRFAGLSNNMAAAYAAKEDFPHAEAYYRKALAILEVCRNLMDAAVTHVNLAQMYCLIDPDDPRIQTELDEAMACFDDPAAVRDGYYAHTCRKCASAFGFFGREGDERELHHRADAFHAGH